MYNVEKEKKFHLMGKYINCFDSDLGCEEHMFSSFTCPSIIIDASFLEKYLSRKGPDTVRSLSAGQVDH